MATTRSFLLYGDTGSGKTVAAYHAAKLLIQATKKKVRLFSADGGGAGPFVDSGMIERGEVEYADISNVDEPFATVRRIADGYWPRTYPDGTIKHFANDADCATRNWQDYCAYIGEGITSICDLQLGSLASRQENAGFKHSWRINEAEYQIGGLQEGHYGLIQQEIRYLIVNRFGSLPVPYMFWTALVGKGKAARTAETLYGPKAAGDAATERIPSWFQHTLHIERIMAQVRGENGELREKEIIAAWFRRHIEQATGLTYLAKARVQPEYTHVLDELFPHGFVPLDDKVGFGRYLQALGKINKMIKADQEKDSKENSNG